MHIGSKERVSGIRSGAVFGLDKSAIRREPLWPARTLRFAQRRGGERTRTADFYVAKLDQRMAVNCSYDHRRR